MTTDWSDVAARARGLRARSLSRAELSRLAGADGVDALLRDLARIGGAARGDVRRLERARLEAHGERLHRLARAAGERRADVLEVLFGEEDRRSVLALARTLRAGRRGHEALPGLVPTPRLPARSLEILAGLDGERALGTMLSAWRHPLGPPLRAAGDPVSREAAVHRTHLAGLTRAARRGDRFLRGHTRRLVDLHNAFVAVVVAHAGARPQGWVRGGENLDEPAFRAAVTRGPAVIEALGRTFRGTPFGPVFDPARGPRDLERAATEALIAHTVRAARRRPLGTAPVVELSLRLRAEAMDLRTLVRGIAMGAPAARLRDALVTP